MSSLETEKGFFCEEDAGKISNPVKNGTICLQTTTRNGRNAGQLYIYDSTGTWVEYVESVVSSGGGGGGNPLALLDENGLPLLDESDLAILDN